MGKVSLTKVLTSSDNLSKMAEQPGVIEKEVNANKGVASDATKPPTATQDLSTEKEVPKRMEIVLATPPLPAKGDIASKGS